MDCELCGKSNAVYTVIIEGVQMDVCKECSKHGKIIKGIKEEKNAEKINKKKADIELEIVDNFAEIIKREREKRGMTIRQLAEAIAEKESYIDRIERDEVIPEEKVARKLEKLFNIKLLEEVVLSDDISEKSSNEALTVGDIIEIKKKAKK